MSNGNNALREKHTKPVAKGTVGEVGAKGGRDKTNAKGRGPPRGKQSKPDCKYGDECKDESCWRNHPAGERLNSSKSSAPRGSKKSNAVDQALVGDVQKMQGEIDGLKETISELKEPNGNEAIKSDHVAIDMSFMDHIEICIDDDQPRQTVQSTVPVTARDKIRQYIKAHYLLDPPSAKSAKALMNRSFVWAQRTGLTEECVDWAEQFAEISREEYERAPELVGFGLRVRRFIHTLPSVVAEYALTSKWCWLTAITLIILLLVGLGFGLTQLKPQWVFGIVMIGTAIKTIFSVVHAPEVVVEDYPTIEDYCVGPIDREPGSGEFEETTKPRCQPVSFPVGFTTARDDVYIPRLCSCNEKSAIIDRQLLPAVGEADVRKKCWGIGRGELIKRLKPPDLAAEEMELAKHAFLSHFTGSRKEFLTKLDFINKSKLRYISSRTKMFVKREKLLGKALHKRNPRAISGKEEDYLLATGPEYYAWMKKFCREYWSTPAQALGQQFIYTGGMDGEEIGLLVTYYERLGWWAYEGDYSRYDGHNEEEAIEAEMEYYESFMSEDTMEDLRKQLKTTGTSMTGHRFKCKGKVASGVINTSFGNTIRGFMIVAYMMAELGVEDYVVIQLGDDNVIFTKNRLDVNMLVKLAANMGHILEVVERSPEEYDFLEYCSMRFWDIGCQRVLGPKPGRVPAKSFIPIKPLGKTTLLDYCKEVATGMRYYDWVPFVGPIIEGLARPGKVKVDREEYQVVLRKRLEVDQEIVNAQFFRIYGITAAEANRVSRMIDWTEMGKAYGHPVITLINEVDGVTAAGGHNEVAAYARNDLVMVIVDPLSEHVKVL